MALHLNYTSIALHYTSFFSFLRRYLQLSCCRQSQTRGRACNAKTIRARCPRNNSTKASGCFWRIANHGRQGHYHIPVFNKGSGQYCETPSGMYNHKMRLSVLPMPSLDMISDVYFYQRQFTITRIVYHVKDSIMCKIKAIWKSSANYVNTIIHSNAKSMSVVKISTLYCILI